MSLDLTFSHTHTLSLSLQSIFGLCHHRRTPPRRTVSALHLWTTLSSPPHTTTAVSPRHHDASISVALTPHRNSIALSPLSRHRAISRLHIRLACLPLSLSLPGTSKGWVIRYDFGVGDSFEHDFFSEFDYKSLCRRLELQLDKLIVEHERQKKAFEDEVERVKREAQNRISEAEGTYADGLEKERLKYQKDYMESIKKLEDQMLVNQQKQGSQKITNGLN